jgi:hypothetical protein
MNAKFKLLAALVFFAGTLSAQVTLGTIKGTVVDDFSRESVPGSKVWIEGHGSTTKKMVENDGKFFFKGLKPGTYSLHTTSMLKDTTSVVEIAVVGGQITDLGQLKLYDDGMLTIVEVFEPMIVHKDIPYTKIGISDIKHSSNIRNPLAMISAVDSNIKLQEGTGEVIIRGSRPGDAIYVVDGVKVDGMNGIPGAAVGNMMAYTSGVPAKYGDTTGGVIVLETRSYFDLYYAWKARQ